MKVYINPSFDNPDVGDGGIRRCVEAQKLFLPAYGVEFVGNPDAIRDLPIVSFRDEG